MAQISVVDPGDAVEPPTSKSRRLPWVFGTLGLLVIAFVVLYQMLGVATFWIPSQSMQPAVNKDSRIVVWSLGSTERGDIVIFDKPESVAGQTTDLMMRVVGLGGETLSLRDGQVFIDGEVLDEPYLPEDQETPTVGDDASTEFAIPEGHVFVLGDNRFRSFDSRSFGTIPDSSISANNVFVWRSGDSDDQLLES